MAKQEFSRRRFLATSAGAAAFTLVPRHVLGGPGYRAPSDRLNIASVGCGGQGLSDTAELVAGGENIVALCDVDFDFVDRNVGRRATGRSGQANPEGAKLQEAFQKAKRYADFRKMLEEQKDIDAVLIATADHTHAVIAKAAMEMGKHVYCEKPLTWSVNEARVLRETARRTKVVTQMGNQGHSSNDARLINEWVQAGVIGPVHDVYVWTNRPIWPQGVARPTKEPAPSSGGGFGNSWGQRRVDMVLGSALGGDYTPPPSLHWDLFLGPGPEVAYHPMYQPFNWRGWADWGTGALGDMGAHLIDHPFWALNLGLPTDIEATSSPWGMDTKGNQVSHPLATQVVYHFAARTSQPPVRMIWCDGGLMAPRPDLLPESVALDRGGGVFIVGERGVLSHKTYGSDPQLYPETLMEDAKRVPQTYERIKTGHRINWANACKGQGKASCPFEYATMLTETMLLGIVALKTGPGKQIHYNGEIGQVTNVAAANQYLGREYRKGWSL